MTTGPAREQSVLDTATSPPCHPARVRCACHCIPSSLLDVSLASGVVIYLVNHPRIQAQNPKNSHQHQAKAWYTSVTAVWPPDPALSLHVALDVHLHVHSARFVRFVVASTTAVQYPCNREPVMRETTQNIYNYRYQILCGMHENARKRVVFVQQAGRVFICIAEEPGIEGTWLYFVFICTSTSLGSVVSTDSSWIRMSFMWISTKRSYRSPRQDPHQKT